MSWTRSLLTALAVCVLLLTGSVGCGSRGARGQEEDAASPAPAGEVLGDTDADGRHYREVDEGDAPGVGIEVQPDPDGDGSWDVRLTVRDFRFSPAGVRAQAVAGRGLAYLFVDGRLVTRLRTPAHRLPAALVPRGTHQVTVRLHADDGTVWAVDGEPVESTADITASGAEATAAPKATPSAAALSAPGVRLRTGGRASPDRAGKAS
ncbi:hypothetical protein J7F01_02185 [Streptomyces sp. ISL-22]|uniref:hypothetical protein n=1 Tax=unclassified Streptomyces TaxID=2593676 RepID=UPI001BEB25F8|nr:MULTISPECIES: hypothetical protein [unclassified Streptomyces]MBT2423537.1 hypothetical protein [Streptomyces sp. ISL-24]MBT2431030.1 hypothetical protein [Streptomyces sp. ISL-22]